MCKEVSKIYEARVNLIIVIFFLTNAAMKNNSVFFILVFSYINKSHHNAINNFLCCAPHWTTDMSVPFAIVEMVEAEIKLSSFIWASSFYVCLVTLNQEPQRYTWMKCVYVVNICIVISITWIFCRILSYPDLMYFAATFK